MRRLFIVLLLAVVAISAFAKKKEKQELPDQVLAARYVYVTGWHGNELQFRSLSEERNAIFAVQNAVKSWGRYHVVYRPEEADIMLVVKPGYIGMVQGGVNVGMGGTIGTGQDRRPGSISTAPEYGAEANNDSNDYLLVSLMPNENAQSAGFVWRRGQRRGFVGAQGKVPLFDAFRKAVDESEKAKAANKAP